ncbi:MAG: hemolysin family protein [Clostridia bacterium]|jgi:putative hemolysin
MINRMSDDGSIPLQLLVIFILILLNAFFAASEIALLSVNETKMKKMAEKGNKKARHVVKFLENSSKFLSTIQVGVTFSGFLSSAVAADSFATRIVEFVKAQNASPAIVNVSRTASVIIITFILSYFTLVFGELVPKRIAMNKSEKLALFVIGPLRVTASVFSPFIKILTLSVNGVLRLVGINPNDDDEEVTEEEILLMVNEGQEKGVIGNEESTMISNVLLLNDKTASDIMTHRTEVVGIRADSGYETVMQTVTNARYSRFPVYEDRIDNIVGVIHIKDLLNIKNESEFDLVKLMRAPCFVPETQRIDEVFKTLKNTKNHMAIVVDEYGGTAGIATMEDILEELVGNIMDEYDEEEEAEYDRQIVAIGDNSYIIEGLTELDVVNEEFNINLPVEEYDTISGFVIGNLGSIPDENTHPSFEYEGMRFTVEGNNEKRITLVKMELIEDTTIYDDVTQEDF